ncbi:MAG: hypothetical protein HDR95_01030 [Bacteroides sp.]|nr:hypothetical protein [Bacteroidales bacterium]MBD5335883.1 hypothetical protein [Bacteroides sp.]
MRYKLSKIIISLSLVSLLTGCKSKEERFAEAESICFDAARNLFEEETRVFQEACNTYDNFILSHAKKVESTLVGDDDEASTGISQETSLSDKDMWLERVRYFYASLANDQNLPSDIRALANDYRVGTENTRNRLAQLYQGQNIEQKYCKLLDVFSENSDILHNGVDNARADSLDSLINSVMDVRHFFISYQPISGYRLGAYTCEFTDSIMSVNKRLNDYRNSYSR